MFFYHTSSTPKLSSIEISAKLSKTTFSVPSYIHNDGKMAFVEISITNKLLTNIYKCRRIRVYNALTEKIRVLLMISESPA